MEPIIYRHHKYQDLFLEEYEGGLFYLKTDSMTLGLAAYRISNSKIAHLIDIRLNRVEIRRKGIGSWMLNILCSSAIREGATSIEGTLKPDKYITWGDLKSFYLKSGFEIQELRIKKVL